MLDLGEDGVPYESSVDITAFPGCGDLGWPHIHDVDLACINTFFSQRRNQLVVRGGDERHTDAFAFHTFETGDATAIACYQGLGIGDICRDPEELEVLSLAGCSGERAGADLSHLHIAGSHCTYDIAAAGEHAPVDLVAGLLLDLARLHDQAQGHQHVLIGKGDGFLLGESGGGQSQRRSRKASFQHRSLLYSHFNLSIFKNDVG